MKKVIVTGASGFIGNHLCRQLLKNGVEVYGVARNELKLADLCEDPCFHPVLLDFEAYDELEDRILDRGFDAFFHLAHSGVTGSEKLDYEIQLKNTEVSCHLVNTAKNLGCKRFVFAGSIDEYEAVNTPDAPFVDSSHSKIYGACKFTSETIGKVIARKIGIEYVTGILNLTYGEGNQNHILPNVILRNSMRRKPIDLISGKNYFDLIYIDDAVNGLIAIAEKGCSYESYYIGHQKLETFENTVKEICRIIDSQSELHFGKYPDPAYSVNYDAIDKNKIFRDTGFRCRVSLEEGIQKTYSWLKQNDVV